MSRITTTNVLVTTVPEPAAGDLRLGMDLADRLGVPFVMRGRGTVNRLLRGHGLEAGVVCGSGAIRLVHLGRSYAFHPNMARHRITAIEAGRKDRFAEAAQLRPGDRVLDCTCGLGADAAVAACAVGKAGAVSALEASALLAAIVRYGMQHYRHDDTALVGAMRNVDVIHADYVEYLESLETNSQDVVYFDPMFVDPLDRTRSLGLVRLLASGGLPNRDVIEVARRVARRNVVVKDRAPGALLDSLDVPIVSRVKQVWYGRLATA